MRFTGFRSGASSAPSLGETFTSPVDEAVPAVDPLSLMVDATASLSRATSAPAVLEILLSAAETLGAARPRAGLWMGDDGVYSMFQRDAEGVIVPCGSAPGAVYAAAWALEGDSGLVGPVIPLASSGRRWGVLDVTGQITDGSVLAGLSILGYHAALRLDFSEQNVDGPGESDTLAMVAGWETIADVDTLLARVVSDLAAALGADSSAVTLLDAGAGSSRTLFSDDAQDGQPLAWHTAEDGRRNVEAVRLVLRTGEPLAFRWNPVTEALKAGLMPGGPQEGSYAAHPLSDGRSVFGVLDVFSHQPRRFGPAHEALLAYAAVAVARMMAALRRDARLAVERDRSRALARLAVLLAGETDIQEIAGGIVRAARSMWPEADLMYALLPQSEGGLWSIAAIDAPNADDRRHGWARAGEGFAGWVIQTRVPLMISAAEQDPRRGSLDRGQAIQAGMWAPMARGGEIVGVLAVASCRAGVAFAPDDMESLEILAEQGAVALERARERHATQSAFWDAIEALSWAIDARDGYTHGHSMHVTEYTVAIGQRLGLSYSELQTARASALLHDIGKIGIPDHILNKPGQLSPDERKVMESHPEVGYGILLRAASLQALLPGVRYHHERPDGKGYPCGLTGDALPRLARIMAVADAFDAMTSDRVYRKRLTVEKACSLLSEGRGTQWDADAVDVFLKIVEERGTPRLQMLSAEDSGRVYLPSLGTEVFGG